MCFEFLRKKDEPVKMNVQKFLSEALIQICSGIRDAQNTIYMIGIPEADKKFFSAIIVPTPISSSGASPRHNLYMLDFDLAITVEKKSSKSDEVDISVVGMGSHAKSKEITTETNAFISRMKFQIPVIYPSSPNPDK